MALVLVVRRQRAAYKNLCGSLFRFFILNFFLIISHTFDEIDNHRPIYLRQRQNRESESGYFRRHLTVTWTVVVCLHFGVNCAVLLMGSAAFCDCCWIFKQFSCLISADCWSSTKHTSTGWWYRSLLGPLWASGIVVCQLQDVRSSCWALPRWQISRQTTMVTNVKEVKLCLLGVSLCFVQRNVLFDIYGFRSAASVRQPCTSLCNSDSSSPASGTYSIGSIDSPLSSSITPSVFHSRLKTFSANPSHHSFPFLRLKWLHRFPWLFTDTSEHIRFLLSSF